jgi:hypothetical protein
MEGRTTEDIAPPSLRLVWRIVVRAREAALNALVQPNDRRRKAMKSTRRLKTHAIGDL